MVSFGKDLLEFIYNVDEMHAHLLKAPRHAGCQFPHFHTTTASDGQLLLCYSSARGEMLAPVVEGVLRALAPRVYQQHLEMARLPEALEGYAVTWAMKIEALGDAAADAPAGEVHAHVARRAPGAPSLRSAMEVRAASTWHEALASSLRPPTPPHARRSPLAGALGALSGLLSAPPAASRSSRSTRS